MAVIKNFSLASIFVTRSRFSRSLISNQYTENLFSNIFSEFIYLLKLELFDIRENAVINDARRFFACQTLNLIKVEVVALSLYR